MTRASLAAVVLLVAAVTTPCAFAGVLTELIAYDGVNASTLQRNAAVSVGSDTVTSGSSSATASANLSEGYLRASAFSDAGYFPYAIASASIQDRLTFHSGFGLQAKLHWVFSAYMSADFGTANASTTQASLYAEVYSPSLSVVSGHALANDPFCAAAPIPCTVEPGGYDTPEVPFRIGGSLNWTISSESVALLLNLTAKANGNGEWVDSKNTARFFLEVPAEATFSSDSGVFLSQAAPLSVPEPNTVLLILTAVVPIVLRRLNPSSCLGGELTWESCRRVYPNRLY